MLKAATGYSLHPDSRSAGREASEMAARGLHDVKIAFVYCGGDHEAAALMEGAASALPGVPLIGCTSCGGVILPCGFIGGERFVGLLALADPDLEVGVGSAQYDRRALDEDSQDFGLGQLYFDDNPFKTSRTAALRAMEKAGRRRPPSFFFMAGLPGMEDLHLAGLAPVIGRAPFAGVSAADSLLGTNWALLTDDGPLYDGLALAFFYGGWVPATRYACLYRSVGSYGPVTRMIGQRRLAEIDGRPALRVIAEKNQYPRELMRGGDLSLATPLMPLGVMNRSGRIIACHPQYGNADDSLYLGSPLFEGQNLMRLEATVDDIIEGCGRELAALRRDLPGQAGAFHLALNYTWRIAAGERFDELVAGLQAAAGGVPFIGALTNGEHGFIDDGGNACGGPMMSCTGFWS